MLGALFIQIGTNLSNDYSDARRGADTEDRLGPVRVTAGGLVPPKYVLYATWIVVRARGRSPASTWSIEAGWELLLIGAASIVAGVLYTGGPRPYGYDGLGEVFVFLFFGVVAVNGFYYVQTLDLAWEPFALSIPVGLLACAILIVNNIRDLDTDRRAGKKTLAVRLGRERMRTDLLARRLLIVVPARAAHLAGLRSHGLDQPRAAGPAAGAAARPHRPRPHRRRGAEPGARRHARGWSWSSACCSPPACC